MNRTRLRPTGPISGPLPYHNEISRAGGTHPPFYRQGLIRRRAAGTPVRAPYPPCPDRPPPARTGPGLILLAVRALIRRCAGGTPGARTAAPTRGRGPASYFLPSGP